MDDLAAAEERLARADEANTEYQERVVAGTATRAEGRAVREEYESAHNSVEAIKRARFQEELNERAARGEEVPEHLILGQPQ